MTKADAALDRLHKWAGDSEPDLYSYLKDFFVEVLGYPRESVKINSAQKKGIPDITLISKDSVGKLQFPWVVCEVKRERETFADPASRKEVLETQLKRYVTADTVYALLVDPGIIAIYLPDLRETKIVVLKDTNVQGLQNAGDPQTLAFLSYENSTSEKSLGEFREGLTPTGYLSVMSAEDQERFHGALKISARELIEYASAKLHGEKEQYVKFSTELQSLKAWQSGKTSLRLREAKLRSNYASAIKLVEGVLPEFERQVGKQTPPDAEKAAEYVSDVFGSEAASLVLSRIIFVRFAEDHKLVTRKISNGGIKAFRQFYTYLKDDYRWLLKSAYEDVSRVYARLFEESIFDWAQEGNSELAKTLERIFYRLNAFNFEEISGDILGNLYEAFLDRPRRKKLGEYYTKPLIVKFILSETGFVKEKGALLDPACGSGSFLVQALKQSVDDMISRGISPRTAIQSSLELIHGLDINVFASFITQLQVLWTLFPYLDPEQKHRLPEMPVYGGLNSLEYDPQLTLGEAITAPLEREATLTRDSKYHYVVGNPPYIRNERLKDTGPWRSFYSTVDTRNSDVAFFFVQRALVGGQRKIESGEDTMPPWLEEKGVLGFVLSLGFANSAAALALRQALLKSKILHIVDLELVAYKLFDADIVPMLIIVQKETPPQDWQIAVRVVDPSHVNESNEIDVSKAPPSYVNQSLLEKNIANPFGYFLTKIQENDVPILKKLLSNPKKLSHYAQPLPTKDTQIKKGKKNPEGEEETTNVALLYGMKLGSGKKIQPSKKNGAYPLFKGSDVATYHLDDRSSEGWVDPEDVESKSVWGYDEEYRKVGYVLPRIVVAPISAKFNPKTVAFNDSTIIFVPKKEVTDFPWDIYFNSALVRFIHHVSLRTTILLRRRCTLYGRTLESLPIVDELFTHQQELIPVADELRKLSSDIKKRWDLIDQAIQTANKQRLSTFSELDFSTWSGTAIGEVRITEIQGEPVLTTFDEDDTMSIFFLRGSLPLLKIVAHLLPEDETEITQKQIQTLEVPIAYEQVVKMIDDAGKPDSPDILRFKELSRKADEIIEKAFDLAEKEREYVHKRLAEYPLSLLEPRYPWTAGAHHQATRTYDAKKRFT